MVHEQCRHARCIVGDTVGVVHGSGIADMAAAPPRSERFFTIVGYRVRRDLCVGVKGVSENPCLPAYPPSLHSLPSDQQVVRDGRSIIIDFNRLWIRPMLDKSFLWRLQSHALGGMFRN